MKWPNLDNTFTVNSKEIFARPLKLRGSGPFQRVFIEKPISHYYIIETWGHTITLYRIIQFCFYTWGNFFSCFAYTIWIVFYTFYILKKSWRETKRWGKQDRHAPGSSHKYSPNIWTHVEWVPNYIENRLLFYSDKLVGEDLQNLWSSVLFLIKLQTSNQTVRFVDVFSKYWNPFQTKSL